MIRLVLSDMDNTLVPFGEQHVTPRTIEAIRACQEAGVDFAPASGRERSELASFFSNDASCYNTAVTVNGQRVYYLGEVISETTLDHEAMRRVRQIVVDCGYAAFITYRDNGFGDWVGIDRDALGRMYNEAFKSGGCHWSADRVPDYPVVKAGIVCLRDEQVDSLGAALAAAVPQLDYMHTVTNWLDVTPHGISKAKGVQELQKILGLSPEEICVFGDSNNDLTMLEATPNACVVANANRAARSKARWVVPSCADEGVAWALEQIAQAARESEQTGMNVLPAFMR